jgi:murein DD-endopeptidase MepM/ murein hydrolase activator NlpD
MRGMGGSKQGHRHWTSIGKQIPNFRTDGPTIVIIVTCSKLCQICVGMIVCRPNGSGTLIAGLRWMQKGPMGCFLGIIFSLLLVFSGNPPLLAEPLRSAEFRLPIVLTQTQADIDTLRQQQQQLEQQRLQIQQERERVEKLEKNAQSGLRVLRRNIQATAAQIQASQAKLQQATQSLKRLEFALAKAEELYRQKQIAIVARLQFLQRQPSSRGWAVLLQSKSLNDFLDYRHRLKLLYQSDRKTLGDLKIQSEQLDKQRIQVDQQKTQISLLTQELLAQKSEFENQADYQKQSIDRLKTDKRALEAAEAQLEKDSQAIGNLIQARVAAAARARGSLLVRGSGRMVFPSNGEITSGFGWRTHPILGYERFHAGVDFGADYGSEIFAADRGVVIFAGWYGGYGDTVIIDHGSGITTLYGHTSGFYIAEGDSVERGQPIAAVGSSGLSTGPHLHFEVRQDGEPVDPMTYF